MYNTSYSKLYIKFIIAKNQINFIKNGKTRNDYSKRANRKYKLKN